MRIQKFGTDGLALVHSADGREMISMTREQALDVLVQLSTHFPDDKDRRIADLVTSVESLKFNLSIAHARINNFEKNYPAWPNDPPQRLSAELIPYIPQEPRKGDCIHKSGCATERSGGRVCDCFLPQEAKQPPAPVSRDSGSWYRQAGNSVEFGCGPIPDGATTYDPTIIGREPPASIQKRKPFTGGISMGPAHPDDELKGGVFELGSLRTAESHANAATPPTSIMKGDKEISDLRGQLRSHASHANALRGNLEADTQASRELGSAWKGWKA